MGSYCRHCLFLPIWPKEVLACPGSVLDWNFSPYSFGSKFSFLTVKLHLSNLDGGREKETQGGRQIRKRYFRFAKGWVAGGREGWERGDGKGGSGGESLFFSRAFPVFTCNTSYQLKIFGNLRRVPEISENNVVKN